ncbi:uncharacterized protein [Amphiura filiformis]|uniref:uncharacterized protein n=1 Tax=Amphiura filiformis TaxID=82378 RepID=UPI003B216C20
MANVKYRKLGEEDTKDPQTRDDEEERDSERTLSGNSQKPYSWCNMALKVTTVLVALVIIGAVIIPYVVPAPLHAQCTINWEFPSLNCSGVSNKLVSQIKKWTTDDNCPGGAGEKCLYTLKTVTAAELQATHETPVKHYVDDLTFNFMPNGKMCDVKGFSTSETWYAVLDSGTNYCNLHNLITGSGLNETTGFVEKTSDDVCTQYSSADCEKY